VLFINEINSSTDVLIFLMGKKLIEVFTILQKQKNNKRIDVSPCPKLSVKNNFEMRFDAIDIFTKSKNYNNKSLECE